MRKFIVIGDLHYTGIDFIDEKITKFLEQLFNTHNNHSFIFLGDVFDNFNISAKNNSFYDFLKKHTNKEVIIINGNHDFSKGRNALIVAEKFSNHIKLIQDYEYLDIEDVRLHFKNYFRKAKTDYNLSSYNLLFTHADLDINQPPKYAHSFEKVINGHIHDYNSKNNIIFLGAIRKCNKAESYDKHYLELEIEKGVVNYIDHKFNTIIDVKEILSDHIDNIEIEEPTILRIMTTPTDNIKDLETKLVNKSWYNQVLVKYGKYINKLELDNILKDLNTDSLNIKQILKEYIKTFNNMFGENIDSEDCIQLFSTYYEKFNKENQENSLNILKFKKIVAQNFKSFKYLDFDFDEYKYNIIEVAGTNKDEYIDTDNPSSNASGKSNFRKAIEYVFLGAKNPLNTESSSGFVELSLKINNDSIVLKRSFTKTKNDLFIKINNIDFEEKETNTDKLKLFYDKYKVENALPFILISNMGLTKYFFSSKSVEKYKLLTNIFPVLVGVDKTIEGIIDDDKKLKENTKVVAEKIVSVKEKRKALSNILAKDYFQNSSELRSLSIEVENLNKALLSFDKVEKEYKCLEKCKPDYLRLKDFLEDIDTKSLDIYKKYNYDQVNTLFNEFEINFNNLEIISNYEKDLNRITQQEEEKLNRGKLLENKIESLISEKKELSNYEYINIDIVSLTDKYKLLDKYKNNNMSQTDIKFYKENKDIAYNISLKTKDLQECRDKEIVLENNLKIALINKTCKFCGGVITNIENYKEKSNKELEEVKLNIKKIKAGIKKLNGIKLKIEALKNSIEDESFILSDNYSIQQKIFLEKELANFKNLDEIKAKQNRFIEVELELNQNEKELFSIQKNLKDISLNKNEIISRLNSLKEIALKFDREYYKLLILDIKKAGMTKQIYLSNLKGMDEIKYLCNKLSLDFNKDVKNKVLDYFDKLNKMYDLYDNLNKLRYDFTFKKDNLSKIYDKVEVLKKKIKKENKENSLTKLKKEHKSLSDDSSKLDMLVMLLKSKRKLNFKSYFTNQFFSKFKFVFDMFLKILFTKNISLNVKDGKFNFISSDSRELEYLDDFSGGEQKKLDIALLLVVNILFSNYGVKSKQLFIDEFLDSDLDAINLERVFYCIKKFFKDCNIFVVSHKDIDKFKDTTINIRKENGVSFLN